MHNRQQIFDVVTKEASINAAPKIQLDFSRPSTSRDYSMQIINANKENVPPVEISWDDLATEITIDDLDCVPISMSKRSQELQAVFVTVKNNPIQHCENQFVTIEPQSSSKASRNLSSKPLLKFPSTTILLNHP